MHLEELFLDDKEAEHVGQNETAKLEQTKFSPMMFLGGGIKNKFSDVSPIMPS